MSDQEKDMTARTEAEEVAEAVETEETATTTEEAVSEEAATDKETEKASKIEEKQAKKKEKADKKKDKAKEKIDELEDKVKRQLAEFENFRNRSEKEKAAMFDMGAKSIVEKVLPVVDNFERGLTNAPEGDAFADGMKMIYKQLITELDAVGVKPIEAVGCEFNPELHNAVMQVESEEFESGIVAQELQKGYMYRDTVVRHSMVAVVS